MRPRGIKSLFLSLLCLIGVLQACDFRQMVEERPVKLPQESSEPNEVSAASNSEENQSTNASRGAHTFDTNNIKKPNPPE
jgi:hypothetical protein